MALCSRGSFMTFANKIDEESRHFFLETLNKPTKEMNLPDDTIAQSASNYVDCDSFRNSRKANGCYALLNTNRANQVGIYCMKIENTVAIVLVIRLWYGSYVAKSVADGHSCYWVTAELDTADVWNAEKSDVY